MATSSSSSSSVVPPEDQELAPDYHRSLKSWAVRDEYTYAMERERLLQTRKLERQKAEHLYEDFLDCFEAFLHGGFEFESGTAVLFTNGPDVVGITVTYVEAPLGLLQMIEDRLVGWPAGSYTLEALVLRKTVLLTIPRPPETDLTAPKRRKTEPEAEAVVPRLSDGDAGLAYIDPVVDNDEDE